MLGNVFVTIDHLYFEFSHYYILLSSQAITAVSGMASNGWFTGMIDIAIPYEMNEV